MYCKDCGSTVTSSDRFCPACGTPNVGHKFHPQFGPGVKVFEPKIMTERAPAGAPSCPRCHRLMEREHEYCGGCGMKLDEVWERLDRVTVINEWRQRDREIEPFRSNRLFGEPLLATLTVGIVISIFIGVANFLIYARGEHLMRSGPNTASIWRVLDVATTISVFVFVVGAALAVLWMRRAYVNLSALAVGELRFRSIWAVIGWIVPGFNFFRPKQVMDDLWRGSHPYAPPFSSSWRIGPAPVWSAVWWATTWVGLVLVGISRLVMRGGAIDGPQSDLLFAALGGIVMAASAACLQLLVRRINERQELRKEIVLGDADAEERDDDADDRPTLIRHAKTREEAAGKY